MVGFATGRWWSLLAAAGIGVWVGVVEEVEVPGWFLGAGYALAAGMGIAAGVGLRVRLAEHRRP